MKTESLSFFIPAFLLFPFAIFAQTGESWHAASAVVERLSKSRSEVNYYEEKVPEYTLPDALTTLEGKKVTTPGMWKGVRCEEIDDNRPAADYASAEQTGYQRTASLSYKGRST